MISTMSTPTGMTLINQKTGQMLRVNRSNPVFDDVSAVVTSRLTLDQVWDKVRLLLTDPLEGLRQWLGNRGLHLTVDSDHFSFGGSSDLSKFSLSKTWLPYLESIKLAGGDPKAFISFLKSLINQNVFSSKDMTAWAKPQNFCVHVHQPIAGHFVYRLLGARKLPEGCSYGDLVTESSIRGSKNYLVSYDSFNGFDGELVPNSGIVLRELTNELDWLDDILGQPMSMGTNRTYQCEEGTGEGWFNDLATDSLALAKVTAKEIISSGSEARVINRITGDLISLT